MLFVIVTAMLSACAGRPKQLDPTQTFNVTEVQVTAQAVEDYGFAGQLQSRLEASVGRATADIGRTSALKVVVIGRQQDPSPLNFFSRAFRSASLSLTLTDPDTGNVLRSRALRATTSSLGGTDGEAALVARLTEEIRYLLGLSGYTPYPVGGIKQDVVLPGTRPSSDQELGDTAILLDPLLNGTVTPTTVIVDAEPETAPAVFDISRPLLDAAPAEEEQIPADAAASPALVQAPQEPEFPAQQPDIASAAGTVPTGAPGDEPCIITLDNDCSDPDSR